MKKDSVVTLRFCAITVCIVLVCVFNQLWIKPQAANVQQDLQGLTSNTEWGSLSQSILTRIFQLNSENYNSQLDGPDIKLNKDIMSMQAGVYQLIVHHDQFHHLEKNKPYFASVTDTFRTAVNGFITKAVYIAASKEPIKKIDVDALAKWNTFELIPASKNNSKLHASIILENTYQVYIARLCLFVGVLLLILITELHIYRSKSKLVESKLEESVKFDKLTGLLNRQAFEMQAEQAINKASQSHGEMALFYLSVGGFKLINDSLGHMIGDRLLVELSQFMASNLSCKGSLARLGGDVFVFYIDSCSKPAAKQNAEELIELVDGFEFRYEEAVFHVDLSIGIVHLDQLVEVPEVLSVIHKANEACFAAKYSEQIKVKFYHEVVPELEAKKQDVYLISLILNAMRKETFELYAQPIVSTLHGQHEKMHYEVLLRLKDGDKFVSPAEFIPVAEKYGIIKKVDRWVTEHVVDFLMQNPEWVEQLELVSVNLSGASVTDVAFVDELVNRVKSIGPIANKLCFEITETAMISNMELATQFVASIKKLGCSVALDDFGSGLSSFAHLRSLDVDFLKIDGYFVRDVAHDPVACEMVNSMHKMANLLGKKTIAEYVENEEIFRRLIDMGVDYAQGYFLGKPQPIADYVKQAKVHSNNESTNNESTDKESTDKENAA